MGARKIPFSSMYDNIDYPKEVQSVKEYQGLLLGDELTIGTVIQLCVNHSPKEAWAVVKCESGIYEIDLPYEEVEI